MAWESAWASVGRRARGWRNAWASADADAEAEAEAGSALVCAAGRVSFGAAAEAQHHREHRHRHDNRRVDRGSLVGRLPMRRHDGGLSYGDQERGGPPIAQRDAGRRADRDIGAVGHDGVRGAAVTGRDRAQRGQGRRQPGGRHPGHRLVLRAAGEVERGDPICLQGRRLRSQNAWRRHVDCDDDVVGARGRVGGHARSVGQRADRQGGAVDDERDGPGSGDVAETTPAFPVGTAMGISGKTNALGAPSG